MSTLETNASTGTLRIAFRETLGRPLRVGGIDYLNSRPLIECFDDVAGAEVELRNLPPNELARGLRRGELDVALVPAVEYFLAPADAGYRIVPGISISSYGAVESIRLFHRRPLGDVRRVALDRTSLTSQLLTRLLFAERPLPAWRSRSGALDAAPEFEVGEPDEILASVEAPAGAGGPAESADAGLLIGDSALQARPGRGWRSLDLGLEWTRWLGLPFVYALWVLRGEAPPGLVECFHLVRHRGCARIDAIVDRGPLPGGMSRQSCLRYLSHVIRYRLGAAELEGLGAFVGRLGGSGILDPERARRQLRFLPDGSAGEDRPPSSAPAAESP